MAMVLHLGGKFLSVLAWLRAKRLLSDWMLGTVNIDSDWLPRGLSFKLWGGARPVGRAGEKYYENNENKIDRERQRAGASAQNEWQRGTEANMRKKPKTGEGRGNKRRQSQSGRDVGGAKHETGRNGQNKESEQNKLVWFTVHECMRNRLKLLEEGEGESWLRGFKRLRPFCRIVGKFVFAIGDSENCLCLN
ncbi:hypothetical protein TNCV_272821 [Trichonephila clavipes]|nr:hypothetical protein TNCV_272821 [Trichonephila clavipes]